MAKEPWKDPFENLPRGGNIMRRVKPVGLAPAAERKAVAAKALAKPKPAKKAKPKKKGRRT